MNWFKRAQTPVMVGAVRTDGVAIYIDGIRYFCPQNNPGLLSKLNQLIKAKRWGDAKQLARAWPCINEQREQQQFRQEQLQGKLFNN